VTGKFGDIVFNFWERVACKDVPESILHDIEGWFLGFQDAGDVGSHESTDLLHVLILQYTDNVVEVGGGWISHQEQV